MIAAILLILAGPRVVTAQTIGGSDETSENLGPTGNWLIINMTPGCIPAGVTLTGDHLLISEVAPRGAGTGANSDSSEYIEIYNPTADPVDLDNYYITDDRNYYLIVNGPYSIPPVVDYNLRFPPGSTILPGEVVLVVKSELGFLSTFGGLAGLAHICTNKIFAMDNRVHPPTLFRPMIDAAGSSLGTSGVGGGDIAGPAGGALTNPSGTNGEWVMLYQWDGGSDLVCDVDYASWGSGPSLSNNPKLDKTGVFIDGPDLGFEASSYNNDTPIASQTNLGSFSVLTKPNTYQRVAAEAGEIAAGGNGCVEIVPMALSVPGALNLRSLGHWVTAYLQPPAGIEASTIVVSSIQLHGNIEGAPPVPVDPLAPTAIGDQDGDQVPDLMVKFDRGAVELTLNEGQSVPVTVTGTVAGKPFSGTTTLKVLRAQVTAPAAGSVLSTGTVTTVRWEIPVGVEIQSVALLSSLDDGRTWTLEAKGIPNHGSYDWTVPGSGSDHARLAVVFVESADATGYFVDGVLGLSEAFTILAPVGVWDRAPVAFALHGVSPNPGHGVLHVDLSLANDRPARIEVLDVMGRRVLVRELGGLGPGRHQVEMKGGLQAGVYLVRLTQGNQARVVTATVLE